MVRIWALAPEVRQWASAAEAAVPRGLPSARLKPCPYDTIEQVLQQLLVTLPASAVRDVGLGEATIKKFTTKIRVYWSDCDVAGIAYYGNFFRFFEQAEEDLYFSLGRPRPSIYHDLQVGFPRVETWCRYYKPARMGDLLEITTWIGRRSERSMQFCFEVRRDGDPELAAEGHYSVVSINRKFQPIPLPEEVLHLLREYLPPVSKRAAAK